MLKNTTLEIRIKALTDVLKERALQDKQWGVQDRDWGTWLLILQEETGEFSKACLESKYGGDKKKIGEELVQVCAVALAMLECWNRTVAKNRGKNQ